MRILLVDDEPAIRDALQPVLAAQGHEVLSAESASSAVRAVRTNATDLILLLACPMLTVSRSSAS